MSERITPYYCPYCGDEDLRPHTDSHGAWECRSCARVFVVKFLGLHVPPTPPDRTASAHRPEGAHP